MTNEKFISEVRTLKKFFTKYCEDKHEERQTINQTLNYKDVDYNIELTLCPVCIKLINYSFDRLHGCPHEIKPRCRTCPSPCYEKTEWKKLAKLMRYSGFQFGLTKIKNFFKFNKKV